MSYDPLDQAQLDRLCAGFQERIKALESTVSTLRRLLDSSEGSVKTLERTIASLDEMLETAAAKIETLEQRLAEAQNPDGWKCPNPRADK